MWKALGFVMFDPERKCFHAGTKQNCLQGSHGRQSPRLNANCASLVIASHSSKMTILYCFLHTAPALPSYTSLSNWCCQQCAKSTPSADVRTQNRSSKSRWLGPGGGGGGAPKQGAAAGEVLDLLPDHANTAIVRCIQLEHHAAKRFPVQLSRHLRARFAPSRPPQSAAGALPPADPARTLLLWTPQSCHFRPTTLGFATANIV